MIIVCVPRLRTACHSRQQCLGPGSRVEFLDFILVSSNFKYLGHYLPVIFNPNFKSPQIIFAFMEFNI